MNSVALQSRPSRAPGVLKQETAGTLVLFKLEGGEYYALNDVGGRVWDLCDGQRTVAEMVSVIAGEYEAPPDTVQGDVVELLTDLAAEHLLQEHA